MSVYSVSLTEEEERKLKFCADAAGLSLSTYIKYVATANTKMITALHNVIDEINKLPLGESFRIRELIPEAWSKLDQSERRSLGIALSNLVKEKKLSYLTVVKDTNGDVYSISFKEQPVKFEMAESTKAEMKALLNDGGKFSALKAYSPELSAFCDRIAGVIDKTLKEQQAFMDKKRDEALNFCGNSGVTLEALSALNKPFLQIELDAEASSLIDELLALQSKCISNLFMR